jgi:2-(1,2-epoxy-1,2-dihydrophenyl)acetyl-CoA isomerase
MTHTQEATLFEVHNGVATLTLNEAAKMNPLSAPLSAGVLTALQLVQDEPAIRVLVLRGNGKGFCVGADLGELVDRASKPGGPPLSVQIAALMDEVATPIITRLRKLRVPVLCAIDGAVAGGGVGLALAADIVIATKSSYFYLPFVPALGMVPDMGVSWFLPRALGPARARALTLLGGRLPAEQAADWGLIWTCVEDADALSAQAGEMAAKLADLPAHSALEVRALYDAADGSNLRTQLDYERARQRVLSEGEAFNEGVKAFSEQRRPDFRQIDRAQPNGTDEKE